MKMNCDYLISHLDGLPGFEVEWEAIQQDFRVRSPLACYSYSKKWYENFASPGDIRVYRVSRVNEVLGFMPW